MVVVLATAGYGILHRQRGPSLQSQIAVGAQVSADTQAQDPATGGPRPYPWWQRPGGMTLVAVAHTAAARSPRVSGAKVMAIGDSVMLASAPELAQALPGIYINAQVSRAMIAGVAIVQQLRAERRLRPVLIVALGTNGPISADQISQLRAALGASRWLVLVNTFVPRPWEQEVNSTLAAAASRYPNVLLVNWHVAIEHHTNLLWSDGIHPQPVGGKLYAQVVRAVVLRALRSKPPASLPVRMLPHSVTGYLLHAAL
jgi:hypothetical protein